ncbi:Uncharacterised protein [Acinetobacter baumannii]|nr:Uncharacterised protein [Acinetobacter baumannii]
MTPEQVAYQENLQTWIHWQKAAMKHSMQVNLMT